MLDKNKYNFDEKLAMECANAFADTSLLGCVVSSAKGEVVGAVGYSCAACKLCEVVNKQKEICERSQLYSMIEAERFGGKYIYFCPLGLTCFVSPILGELGSAAKITVGPFLMTDHADFISCDLENLSGQTLENAKKEILNIPVIEPERINKMSNLLFMAVSFINNVSQANRMRSAQSSTAIQGQISSYISQLKGNEVAPYPFSTERALLQAVEHLDKANAQKLLNELFGYIFFVAGGDFEKAKSRVCELLVLISRSAIIAGAPEESTLEMNNQYIQTLPNIKDMEQLCLWLTEVMNAFMDRTFEYIDFKHANVMHQSILYINNHYQENITLEDMARRVYLSPSYFSRVFKKENGMTFSAYLNKTRIAYSKELLLHTNMRLVEIALQVGYEDQSYFSKVFHKIVGVPPLKYRAAKGQKNNE